MKIFVSYSWEPKEYVERVYSIISELESYGIEVVYDKAYMKAGNDRFKFMELMMSKEIHKVLIMCNRSYTEKADIRKGGVGIETLIITSEVYGSVNQDKFIPVAMEKDDEGNAWLPIYLKSRFYIDFTSPQKQKQNIYELLNEILDSMDEKVFASNMQAPYLKLSTEDEKIRQFFAVLLGRQTDKKKEIYKDVIAVLCSAFAPITNEELSFMLNGMYESKEVYAVLKDMRLIFKPSEEEFYELKDKFRNAAEIDIKRRGYRIVHNRIKTLSEDASECDINAIDFKAAIYLVAYIFNYQKYFGFEYSWVATRIYILMDRLQERIDRETVRGCRMGILAFRSLLTVHRCFNNYGYKKLAKSYYEISCLAYKIWKISDDKMIKTEALDEALDASIRAVEIYEALSYRYEESLLCNSVFPQLKITIHSDDPEEEENGNIWYGFYVKRDMAKRAREIRYGMREEPEDDVLVALYMHLGDRWSEKDSEKEAICYKKAEELKNSENYCGKLESEINTSKDYESLKKLEHLDATGQLRDRNNLALRYYAEAVRRKAENPLVWLDKALKVCRSILDECDQIRTFMFFSIVGAYSVVEEDKQILYKLLKETTDIYEDSKELYGEQNDDVKALVYFLYTQLAMVMCDSDMDPILIGQDTELYETAVKAIEISSEIPMEKIRDKRRLIALCQICSDRCITTGHDKYGIMFAEYGLKLLESTDNPDIIEAIPFYSLLCLFLQNEGNEELAYLRAQEILDIIRDSFEDSENIINSFEFFGKYL